MLTIAIGISMFFAMNIGASGAAATMGAAYGSGAVKKIRIALLIVAVGVFLGAYLGGGEVVKTLGEGIIPPELLDVHLVIIILLSATVTLFASNLMGIPLSTSEVTVGSVVGVGVAFSVLYVKNVLVIVSFWIIVPLAAFGLAWVMGKLISALERRDSSWTGIGNGRRRNVLVIFMIGVGFLEAFSAGMNNVANAVGPLVGAGIMSSQSGVLWGGLFVALGALLLGGRVLNTNGKKITNMSLLQGIAISGTGGVLVIIASLFGIPVPLTQITTTAILGIGTAEHGFRLWQKSIISRILKVWLVSPLLSMVASYSMVKLFVMKETFTLVALVALLIATIGLKSLYDSIQREKGWVNEDGGGI